MSNMYVKKTFGAESRTKIGVFGTSITGGYSFADRWSSYINTTTNFLKQRGFNIDVKNYAVNGGTLYDSRHSSYVIPAYVVGSRRSRINAFSLDQALSDGMTHAWIFFDHNDTSMDYTDANPSGRNIFGEEQIDLIQNYIDVCVANGVVPIVSTTNCLKVGADAVMQGKLRAVADSMKSVWDVTGQAYLDIFYTLADPALGYFGKAVDYFDDVHWNKDDGSVIGHGKMKNALLELLTSEYQLTTPVYTLVEDKYTIGSACVTVPAGQELLINPTTGAYLINPETGAYLTGDI